MTAMESYGVREQYPASDELDLHVQDLLLLGYTVLPSGWSEEKLDDWRKRLDRLHAQQCGGRSEMLRALAEDDVVRAPLARDETFLATMLHPSVLAVCRRLLGDNFILMLQNGILNRSSDDPHHQTAYHRDLPYQHWVSSRPVAVSVLLCLDQFRPETGSTLVVIGSHKHEFFPSDAYVAAREHAVTAPTGSFIMFDSMLFHRAGVNHSGRVRRAINHVYTLPFLKQQIVLPSILDGKWSDSPELARLLGYETNPPGTIDDWLETRKTRRAVGKPPAQR